MKKVLMIFLLSGLGVLQVEAGTEPRSLTKKEADKLQEMDCSRCVIKQEASKPNNYPNLVCICKKKDGKDKTTTLNVAECQKQQNVKTVDELVEKGLISNCDGELTCGKCENK